MCYVHVYSIELQLSGLAIFFENGRVPLMCMCSYHGHRYVEIPTRTAVNKVGGSRRSLFIQSASAWNQGVRIIDCTVFVLITVQSN